MSFEEKVIERDLNKWNVLVSSLIAGFSKLGILSQAVVNKDMEMVAEKLARYFKVQHHVPEVSAAANFNENLTKVIKFLDLELEMASQKKIVSKEDTLEFQVTTNTCNFCPKGVGEAELSGTACPYPALIKEFAQQFLPDDQKVDIVMQNRNSMRKESGTCYLIFRKR